MFIWVAAREFIEAIDAILVDDSYELPSPVAYVCRKAAELLHVWIMKSENKSDLESFSKHLHSKLLKATILLLSSKINESW